jgi:IS30 family transposase
VHSQTHLNKVARQLNERPRKTLTFETPADRPVEPTPESGHSSAI